MTGGDAYRADRGQDAGHAPGRAAGYVAYLDPVRVPGDAQALALLTSVLAAPSGCVIFATDTEGKVLAWSETACAVLGHRPSAVLGRLGWADLVPGSGPAEPALPVPLASALRDGVWQGLQDFVRPGGERVTCQVAVSRLPGGDGQPAGLLVLAREAGGDLRRLAGLEEEAAAATALFAGNPVPVAGTDPIGVITHVNQAAEALLGHSRSELAGTRLSDCFTAPGRARSAIGRTLRDGTADDELEIRRPGGAPVAVGLTAATYPGPDGRLAGLVASLTDLTDRNRGRAELQRAEAYHRELIEAAGDGLVAVDPAGVITDVNGPACVLLGFRRDELTGSPLADCFTEPREVSAAIGQALAGEPLRHHEFPVANGAPGQARQVSLSASVFRSPATREPRVILSLHDVTEQAALRDRLARERGYNRSIIESSANGLAMVDLRDRISDVNETLCRLTGHRREDLIGAGFADLFTEPDTAGTAVHQALATGRTATCELRLATSNQPQVSVSASPIRTPAGDVLGVLASTRDVSEQARLRRALAAEQDYNRALVDSSLNGLFVLTPDGRITDVNSVASRLTGHPRGRLVGRPFAHLFQDAGAAGDAVSRAFTGGQLADCELALVAGPPQVIVSVSGGVFTDPRSRGKVLLAVMRDITEDKQTRARLQYYAESLFDAIVDAFAATDVAGVIVDANQPWEALVGRSLAEITGHPLDEYFTEPERARGFLSAVLRDGKVTDCELTARRPGGSTTVVSASAATYSDSEGKVAGVLAAARDMTDRKKFERQQATLLDRARELDQAKTDFVSRVSHELRSPLTSVLGYLELLGGEEPGPLTKEQRRMLEVVNRNGRRLLALIEDLLLLSRIEAGTVTITWQPLQLDRLVHAVHETFAGAIRKGQLTSQLAIEADVRIEGDERQLERLVTNLLSNAVKFTPPGGSISLSLHRDGDQVVIEVTDTGIGIPEEEQSRLFTRFFRSAMATERETQGTGLGLFIVKHVAEAHGGTVAASSSPGAGSTFTVRLPARPPFLPRPPGQEVPS